MVRAVSLADEVSPGERHWILAQQARFDGNLPEAREHGDELLKLYPRDKRVAQLAGNLLRSSPSDLHAALRHYEKATALDTRFASAYNQIVYAQSRLGEYAAAEVVFKQYIALRPASPNPYDSYAELLMKMGRYDDSIAQYQKALDRDPRFSSALAGIGQNEVFNGDFAKGRESYQLEFDQASNVNGKTGSLFWTTTSYVYEGNLAEALKSIERQRDFAEKENLVATVIGTHEQAAFILAESGDLAGSVEHIEAASRLVEESALPASAEDAVRLRVMLARARILTAVHEFDSARTLVDECQAMVDLSGNSAEARAREGVLGMLELEQGHDSALCAPHGAVSPYADRNGRVSVAGPRTIPARFEVAAGTVAWGVRCRPGAAAALLPVEPASLRNVERDLDLPRAPALAARLARTDGEDEAARAWEEALPRRLADARPLDGPVMAAAETLSESGGCVLVEELAAQVGLSAPTAPKALSFRCRPLPQRARPGPPRPGRDHRGPGGRR